MAVCVEISSTREGGIDLSSGRIGAIEASSERIGAIALESLRRGTIDASSVRVGRIMVSSSFVCEVSHLAPYLEIEPEMVWMTDYGVDNQVYSNTNWNIN